MVSEAPERIWLSAADGDNEREVWTDPDEGGTEYRRADIAATTALERERDEARADADAYKKGCESWSTDAAELAGQCTQLTARATAAEAAIARLRDENEYLLALLDEAATKLENCRYSEQPMAEKIRTTLRALKSNQEHHDAK